ncbi:MAG: hypothetical protein IPJ18_20185 [Betaproteobacteria bacterium]|nr:hypothetical protein [Betaproteobacteria bacterium]
MPASNCCFMALLSEPDAAQEWPFTIQANGRPIDMVSALEFDRLTGEVEWLSIRQFAEQAAKAAEDIKSRAVSVELGK